MPCIVSQKKTDSQRSYRDSRIREACRDNRIEESCRDSRIREAGRDGPQKRGLSVSVMYSFNLRAL